MIEPQSAQLGASAWVWKLTFVAPRFSVMAEVPPPFPLPVLPPPFAAWPLVAMTFSSPASAAAGVAATAVAFGASESMDGASEAVGGAASEVSVLAPRSLSERGPGAVAEVDVSLVGATAGDTGLGVS